MRPPTWTTDQLRRVLDEGECRTGMEVVVALGLGPYSENLATVRRRATEHGWTLPDGRGRRKRPAPSGADRGRETR